MCEDQHCLLSQVYCLKLGASFSFKDQWVGFSTYYFTRLEHDFCAIVLFHLEFLTEL